MKGTNLLSTLIDQRVPQETRDKVSRAFSGKRECCLPFGVPRDFLAKVMSWHGVTEETAVTPDMWQCSRLEKVLLCYFSTVTLSLSDLERKNYRNQQFGKSQPASVGLCANYALLELKESHTMQSQGFEDNALPNGNEANALPAILDHPMAGPDETDGLRVGKRSLTAREVHKQFFYRENREKLAQCRGTDMAERNRLIRSAWDDLSPHEKRPFQIHSLRSNALSRVRCRERDAAKRLEANALPTAGSRLTPCPTAGSRLTPCLPIADSPGLADCDVLALRGDVHPVVFANVGGTNTPLSISPDSLVCQRASAEIVQGTPVTFDIVQEAACGCHQKERQFRELVEAPKCSKKAT